MATLTSLFENTSRFYANNIAVTFNSGMATEHIPYRELDDQASQVADYLGTLCEGQEILAIYSKQSIGLLACLLGVLKCERCFAPIDLNWPQDIVCKFLLSLNVNLVVVDKDLLEKFQKCLSLWKSLLPSDCHVELIRNQVLDTNGFILVRKLSEFKEDTTDTESLGLAYVMQTSGTTGDAKAVKVPHRCIVPNITDLSDKFQMTSDDVVFLASPYTFDPFIVQMFLAFSTGARLVIIPDSVKMIPCKLVHILFDEERVTVLQPTPSLMYHIGQDVIRTKVLSKDSSLRVLAFGGESCPTLSTLRQWRPSHSKCSIYNLYGITEVSCWASCHHIPDNELVEDKCGTHMHHENMTSQHEDQEKYLIDEVNDVPLGVPLLDTVMEVQDENGKLVQEGFGQIFIGGFNRVCLLGNETSLTAGTMRATGDWAYVQESSMWFCGRRDRQIKRMGKRINLDWIERQITEKLLENVCSLVLEKTAKSHHSMLHLFIAEKSLSYNNTELTSLKHDITNLLPVEARPDCVHMVSHLPMTAHGKADRGSLLASIQKTSVLWDMKSTREFLEQVWKEVLEINETANTERIFTSSSSKIAKNEPGNLKTSKKDVNQDEMFIASGGSSLDAIRLADLIESFVSKQKKNAVDLSELLDIILSKPFDTLCNYVESKLTGPDKGDGLKSKALPEDLHTHRSRGNLGATADQYSNTKGVRLTFPTHENHLNKETIDVGVQQGAESPSRINIKERKLVEQASILPVKRKSFSLDGDTSSKNETAKTDTEDQGIEEYNDSNKEGVIGLSELKSCFCSVHSRNQWTVCEFCKYSSKNTATHMTDETLVQSSCLCDEAITSSLKDEIYHQSLPSLKDHDKSSEIHAAYQEVTNGNVKEKFRVSITCQWRTCLYKCIDASPLVVYSQGRSEGEVYIGSHSHVFMCIRLSDGKVLWESRVGDRIESSAAISKCGRYVIVGCYDSKVYAFNRFTGDTFWTFQTGAAVKSSPCIDTQTGVAWVGSHDHHLYALDVTNKQCICVIDCGEGSCFSSPCISSEPHLVFIATLTGRLLAVDAAEHTIIWSQQCPKPVFASPLLTPTGVVCSCVDGFVYCFDFHGNKLWHFQTNAPLFSSPAYIGTERDSSSGYIVFGCHDKCVYCLSLNGEPQWKFATDGQVYSSPFIAEFNTNHFSGCHTTRQMMPSDKRDTQMAVFVVSTVGTLYVLDLHSGDLLASHSLPGEVFSSPVVINKRVLIGCRNDYLYSIEISTEKMNRQLRKRNLSSDQ